MNTIETKKSDLNITRAIEINPDSRDVIHMRYREQFDLPPSDVDLSAAIENEYREKYYFITNFPGPLGIVSWVILPEFMFNRRFKFATKPNRMALTSVLER